MGDAKKGREGLFQLAAAEWLIKFPGGEAMAAVDAVSSGCADGGKDLYGFSLKVSGDAAEISRITDAHAAFYDEVSQIVPLTRGPAPARVDISSARGVPRRQVSVDSQAQAEQDRLREARCEEEESYLGFRVYTFGLDIQLDSLPVSPRRSVITTYLVELWWDPGPDLDGISRQYLQRWLHPDFLASSGLPIGVTYVYSGRQSPPAWVPWTMACEDTLLQRNRFGIQLGLFALQVFEPGEALSRYRGTSVARCASGSQAYWYAVKSVLELGGSSYLMALPAEGPNGTVELIDCALDREAGAKVANSANGLVHFGRTWTPDGYATIKVSPDEPASNNAHIEPNGSLIISRRTQPLTGLADMRASAVLVDYDTPGSKQPGYFEHPVSDGKASQ